MFEVVHETNGIVLKTFTFTEAMVWLIAKANEYTKVYWFEAGGDALISMQIANSFFYKIRMIK